MGAPSHCGENGKPVGIRSEALECVQLAAAFAPASLLAGIRDCTESKRIQSEVVIENPASLLAGKKAAASCTHSKASLRMPPVKRSPAEFPPFNGNARRRDQLRRACR